ncbi:hypothetical protein TURU_086254 [Turdus rufiventris]|nr:hypothetical protein TURU_086254 [Turdus rufiventris]
MRAPLVTLLAAVLCVEQVFPFMCYTCQDQESNKDCLTISMCAKEDKHCVTIRKDVGTSRFGNSTLFVLEESSPRNGIYSQYRNSKP